MSRSGFLTHWRGLLLSEIGIAAGLWLAFSGRLSWYIHPRYTGFTVTMLLLAAVAVPLACAALSTRDRGDRPGAEHQGACAGVDEPAGRDEDPGPAREVDADHEQDPASGPASGGPRISVWGSGLLIAVSAWALLVLPPATLTASTAEQRQMNASVSGSEGDAAALLAAARTADADELSVRDWSMLLRQGAPVTGQRAEVVGFVAPDPESSEGIFYASRFVVTCCAVDAQPVGVPVHLPDWDDTAAEDDWVRVAGVFAPNPDAASEQPVVLRAEEVELVEAPKDPYVY